MFCVHFTIKVYLFWPFILRFDCSGQRLFYALYGRLSSLCSVVMTLYSFRPSAHLLSSGWKEASLQRAHSSYNLKAGIRFKPDIIPVGNLFPNFSSVNRPVIQTLTACSSLVPWYLVNEFYVCTALRGIVDVAPPAELPWEGILPIILQP